MKRVLIVGVVVVVVGLAAALWFVLSNLNSFVASVIETQGSAVLGSAVRVGSVSIDLREGSGTIRGLRVANPAGFSGGDAFTLGEISVGLDVGSLTGSPIVVKRILVEEPSARFQVDAKGRSNFGVLKSHAEAYGGGAQAPPEPQAEGEPIKLVIHDFTFEKGSLRADFSAVDPESKPIEAELPVVRRKNLGAPSGGTPSQIGKQIATAFTGAVVKTVAAHEAARELENKIGGEPGKAAGGLLKKLLD